MRCIRLSPFRRALPMVVLLCVIAAPARAQESRLEDGWQLLTDPSGALTAPTLPSDGWRPVRVGLPWNAQFEDLRDYMGVAWYRSSFDVSKVADGGHVVLRFGAVDHLAEVFVNGREVGSHEGAYTPFTIDVTDAVRPGSNDLLVRVVDPPPTPAGGTPRFPEMPYEELPIGKQNWYIENGGLWQPVTLEVRPSLYIDAVRVTPTIAGATRVDVHLLGSASGDPAAVRAAVRDPDGKVVAEVEGTASGEGTVALEANVANPRLWSPDTPALYTVEVSLSGGVTDRRQSRFGFREFVARDGRFFLNGEPFYMIGALDQDYYPESIYSTPGPDYVVDMMKKGKALGLNTLRCHIKVCDPVYLDAADEVGLLVWYEVPSWGEWTDGSLARGKKIFEAMTLRDWNHPSIVIQTLINEAWGIDMTQAAQRRGLAAWFDEAKAFVEPLGRLVVDNSPCCTNFHMRTDINDFHQYFSIPDNADRWDKWVADFASRPDWAFSPHGDAQTSGDEPLVVSEFGNWGLPELPDDLPWWFPRDFNGRAITRPAGLFDRFHALGFDRVFTDYPTLARETQWRQFFSLKHEIEEIRRHASIQGYVITEFTDINWEANGLMTMWREPKVYADALADLQRPDVLLPETTRRTFASGEAIDVTMSLSRYGAIDPAGSRLIWSSPSGGSGEVPVSGAVERGRVGRVAAFTLPAPTVSGPTRERLSIELKAASGEVIARTTHDVFVFPEPKAPAASVWIHDPHGALKALPWDRGRANTDVVVASVFDAEMRAHVAAGGHAVVLASGLPMELVGAPLLSTVERRGELDGNWVSNFPWLHAESPALASAAVSRITGFEAARATPRRLITGVPEEAWRNGDVLGGIFFGWLNESRATVTQFRHGDGTVVIATFDTRAYGDDAFTTHLVNGLVDYVASDACAPSTAIE